MTPCPSRLDKCFLRQPVWITLARASEKCESEDKKIERGLKPTPQPARNISEKGYRPTTGGFSLCFERRFDNRHSSLTQESWCHMTLFRSTFFQMTVGLLLLTASIGRSDEKAAAKIIAREDVVYGRVSGAGLLADIAYPESKEPLPAIIAVHGGRWVGGHKKDASTRPACGTRSITTRTKGTWGSPTKSSSARWRSSKSSPRSRE
jgi:hypothetical protein